MKKFLTKYLVIFLAGGLGGVFFGNFLLPFFQERNFLGTAAILAKIIKPQQVITRVEEKTVIVPQAEYFGEAIGKVKASVVAVQSFNQGRLIRSGSGLILTREGLIATVGSVVPLEANVFQVVNEGKIYKAKVVWRNSSKNISLLSLAEGSFGVVDLKKEPPSLGQNLLLFAKVVSFGKDLSLVQAAITSQASENGSFKVSADYDASFFGSALIDSGGRTLGMVDFRNQKPLVVTATDIGGVLEDYLYR